MTPAPDPLVLKVSRLRPDARLPEKAHIDDAAFDLFACEPAEVRGGRVHRVHTGIAIELPPGWAGLILGRSSYAALGITPLGNLIDPGYRGEWIVNLWVPAGTTLDIQPGNKIAQFAPIEVRKAVVVESADLAPSERGTKSYGSSGR